MKASSASAIAIIVLAAGTSSRIANSAFHKLLARFDGVSLVRRSVLVATQCAGNRVCVVTGHCSAEISAEIADIPLKLIINDAYKTGIASSIRAGMTQILRDKPEGVIIMLADMPMITADHLHTLIAEFFRRGAKDIVRAMNSGQLGNPVIFPRSTFHLLMHLEGDQGAGGVLNESGLGVTGIEIGVAAVADVDTVTDILDAGGVIPSKAPARDEADKLQSQVIRLK